MRVCEDIQIDAAGGQMCFSDIVWMVDSNVSSFIGEHSPAINENNDES